MAFLLKYFYPLTDIGDVFIKVVHVCGHKSVVSCICQKVSRASDPVRIV